MTWLRPIRAAILMGLTWAVGWALVGMLIELIHNVWPNPLGSLVDIWPMTLGAPAFLSGLAFSMLLGIAGRRRRLGELSLPVFAALGAAGGGMVSLAPAVMVALGLASIDPPHTVMGVTFSLMVPFAVVGATSAASSLALARRGERREGLVSSEDTADTELADGDTLRLPEGR